MKKIRKAVIPVAGMGTRFLPVTKSVPKEMLPIVDIPTIEYIVDEAVASGIEEILFITSPTKNAIEDYFDRSYELEKRLEASNKIEELKAINRFQGKCKFFYIRQGEPLGNGHAVRLAQSFVGDEPFAIMFGDDIMYYKDKEPVLKQLIDMHEKYNANVIGVQEVDWDSVHKYGNIKYSDEKTGKIETIIEKPKREEAYSNSAAIARYIVNYTIFDILNDLKVGVANEIWLVDALRELMKSEPFYACKYDGEYFDVGSKIGYLKANINFALDRDDLKQDLIEYMIKVTK